MPTDARQREWRARMEVALDTRAEDDLAALLADVYAADLAVVYAEADAPAQRAILDHLTDDQAAELLGELDAEEWPAFLDQLSLDRALAILDAMPSDEAADVLGELPAREADALLARMQPEQADDVAELMRYAEDSAGGLMAKEFVRIAPDDTAADALAVLRRRQVDAEMIYYLYVLDEDERLKGAVSLRELLISDPAKTMAEIMTREVVSVPATLPQDEVAEVVRQHSLLAVPVLDDTGRMLGIVTVDDIGDVLREGAADDLLDASGAEEAPRRPGLLPHGRGWRSGLVTLIGGALGIPVMIVLLRDAGADGVALALVPLVLILAYLGGNQTALAMEHAYESSVERLQLWRVCAREWLAGALQAILGGLMGALVALVAQRSWALAAAVALPTAVSVWSAVVIGALGVMVGRRPGQSRSARQAVVTIIAVLTAMALYLIIAHSTVSSVRDR